MPGMYVFPNCSGEAGRCPKSYGRGARAAQPSFGFPSLVQGSKTHPAPDACCTNSNLVYRVMSDVFECDRRPGPLRAGSPENRAGLC